MGLSAVVLIVDVLNTGVERQFDEPMTFRLIEAGDYRTIEFTTSHGDRVSASSADLIKRLKGRPNQTIRVSMTGWYDYGRLRAYRVQTIDGVSQ